MRPLDHSWLAEKINERRGVQAELARFLGITSDKMTKVMSGNRRIQPEEVPRILQFFRERGELSHEELAELGFDGPDGADAQGFAEPGPKGERFQRVEAVANRLYDTPRNQPGDTAGAIQIAIVGNVVQVAATVDADSFDTLMKRLELAREMISGE